MTGTLVPPAPPPAGGPETFLNRYGLNSLLRKTSRKGKLSADLVSLR